MDMDTGESFTPRHGKGKKKSGLSKMAAKRGKRSSRNTSDESDTGSVSNLRDSDVDLPGLEERIKNGHSYSHQDSIPKYPIDARVEIKRSETEPGGPDEDSDEGIELGSSSYTPSVGTSTHHSIGSKAPSDGTIQRLQSLNVANDDGESDDQNDYGSLPKLKGEKRFRDQNSSGEELDRDSGRFRLKKHPLTSKDEETGMDTESGMPSARQKSKDKGSQGSPVNVRDSLLLNRARLHHRKTSDPFKVINETDNDKLDSVSETYKKHSGPFNEDSRRMSDTLGRDEEDNDDPMDTFDRKQREYDTETIASNQELNTTTLLNRTEVEEQYRQILEKCSMDDERAESPVGSDWGDKLTGRSSIAGEPPRSRSPSQLRKKLTSSSYAPSLYSSQERPWSAMINKSAQMDLVSERSVQSTSTLPMLSTQQAKKRTFLLGSITNCNALLGAEELERFFPDRKMHVFCGTWNMCEMKTMPDGINDFLLPDSSDFLQDMYIIGTQESTSNRREWEVCIQEALGPHYVLFHTAVFGVLYLAVFLRRDFIWFCSVTEESSISTRPGPTGMKTKGAVALSFNFFGTSFLLINSHLTPHDGQVKARVADYHKISHGLKLPRTVVPNQYVMSHEDVTARFDCVFWLGDLNFRLEKERDRVDRVVQGITSEEITNFERLIESDELNRVRNEGLAFEGFQEGRINFRPTFKYDKNSTEYDTSGKMRIPSYTTAFWTPTIDQSNCQFEVFIRPGRDNIPLAAGMFNREIYVEGMRRRTLRLETIKKLKNEKSSAVCSLQ